jgi:hypothetical protein
MVIYNQFPMHFTDFHSQDTNLCPQEDWLAANSILEEVETPQDQLLFPSHDDFFNSFEISQYFTRNSE